MSERPFRVPKILLTAGALLILAGCSTQPPTPYQLATEGQGGYSGTEIEPGRVRVAFSGNTSTPREAVENALLFRAAEVTLHKGFDHFVVTERDTERFSPYGSGAPRSSVQVGYGAGFGCCSGSGASIGYQIGALSPLWGDPLYDDRSGRNGQRYTASAVIVMRRGEVPAGDANAYDARSVMATLGPSIVRPVEPPAEPDDEAGPDDDS